MTTSAEPAARSGRLPRALSWLVGLIGLIMVGTGIAVYAYTSAQLSSQHITVAALSPDNPGALAGKEVADPFTAMAQANAIKHHVGDKTYADFSSVATSNGHTYNKDVTADKSTDGQAHSKGDTLSEDDAIAWAGRQTAMNGSFLQASLLTSVIAFGVSVLIAGLGLVLIVLAVILVTGIAPKPRGGAPARL
ncbi:MAG: hypothetical protein LBV00_05445 [Propionibacteriaceae bacterium]|jgi:hypothetical protein|nr:hypothetical protein [Propionibacteriaceae bacterium]